MCYHKMSTGRKNEVARFAAGKWGANKFALTKTIDMFLQLISSVCFVPASVLLDFEIVDFKIILS